MKNLFSSIFWEPYDIVTNVVSRPRFSWSKTHLHALKLISGNLGYMKIRVAITENPIVFNILGTKYDIVTNMVSRCMFWR